MDIDGATTTGRLTAKQRRRTRRCTSLVPRRVLLTETTDDCDDDGDDGECCGTADEDNTGTDLGPGDDLSANTNTMPTRSATGGTVSALLSAYRSRDGPLSQIVSIANTAASTAVSSSNTHTSVASGNKSNNNNNGVVVGSTLAGCNNKENRLSNLYSLLSTPLHHVHRQHQHQQRGLGRTPHTASSCSQQELAMGTSAAAPPVLPGSCDRVGAHSRWLAGSASCSQLPGRLERVDEYGRPRAPPDGRGGERGVYASTTRVDQRSLSRSSQSCSQLPHNADSRSTLMSHTGELCLHQQLVDTASGRDLLRDTVPGKDLKDPAIRRDFPRDTSSGKDPLGDPENGKEHVRNTTSGKDLLKNTASGKDLLRDRVSARDFLKDTASRQDLPSDTSGTCRSNASDSVTVAAFDEYANVGGRQCSALSSSGAPHTLAHGSTQFAPELSRTGRMIAPHYDVPAALVSSGGAGSGRGEQRTPSTSGTAVEPSLYPTPPSDTSLSGAIGAADSAVGDSNRPQHHQKVQRVHVPRHLDAATQTDSSSAPVSPHPTLSESALAGLGSAGRQLTSVSVGDREVALLGQIGRGGSSKVYKVLDSGMRCLALKIVTLDECDAATMEGFINEIKLLRKLQHSNRVVQLVDWEHKEVLKRLHIIMELGDTDLSTLMRSYAKVNEVSVSMCKFFWEEMLRCVDVIHREGIIHSDLKPSNFLMVSGRLKLIDFGIASQIQTDCTSVMKDYQLGTFNYISPEAIKSQQVMCNGTSSSVFKISRRSDVWSLGCILYNFAYGHTPFSDIKKVMPKMMAIINPDHKIPFPPLSNSHLLSDLKSCLQRNPYDRPTIEQLLSSPYLTN